MQIIDPDLIAYLNHRAGEQKIHTRQRKIVRKALELNTPTTDFASTFGKVELPAYIGFIDLAGFSSAVNGKRPTEIARYLKPFLSGIIGILRGRGLLIDKTIGDEVMFVLPETEEEAQSPEVLLLGQAMGGLHDFAFELNGVYKYRIGLAYGQASFFQIKATGGFSFAAGRRAKANADGSFVWGDATDADIACATANRWRARSSGGVYFYTDSGLTTGVYVAAGGSSWNSTSDRATKEKFEPVDGAEVLERLAAMPIAEYKLKSQDDSIRHIGPVAQDFAVLGYGESDKAINMEDADGVAFAAIQGLYKIVQEKDVEIIALKARLAKVEELVAKFAVQQEGDN